MDSPHVGVVRDSMNNNPLIKKVRFINTSHRCNQIYFFLNPTIYERIDKKFIWVSKQVLVVLCFIQPPDGSIFPQIIGVNNEVYK